MARNLSRWYLAYVDGKPIAVSRINANGEPETVTALVKADPEDFKHGDPAVFRDFEERNLRFVRRPDGNRVPVAALLDADVLREVDHRALGYVGGLEEAGSPLVGHQAHRVEGGLHRPRLLVDETLLVSAHHLGTGVKPEGPRDRALRAL